MFLNDLERLFRLFMKDDLSFTCFTVHMYGQKRFARFGKRKFHND